MGKQARTQTRGERVGKAWQSFVVEKAIALSMEDVVLSSLQICFLALAAPLFRITEDAHCAPMADCTSSVAGGCKDAKQYTSRIR